MCRCCRFRTSIYKTCAWPYFNDHSVKEISMARLTPSQSSQKRQAMNAGLINRFRRDGYAGASLAELGAATGLAKASLYHRFPGGKPDIGRAALAEAGRRFTDLVLRPLQSAAPARERLHLMRDGLVKYYSSSDPQQAQSCLMNTMTIGDGASLFGSDIAATIAAWQKLIESALRDLGRTPDSAVLEARDLIARVQGTLVLAQIEGGLDLQVAWAELASA
jgi:TetR/AcrR family transcriptional regulator, lmrAB and yxaGH operons repressor